MSTEAITSRRRRSGMTLLEVLAAVALLGIVFTALARSATLGVLSEGDSRRRLEASLLADSRLAQLELAASSGSVPELGEEEEEAGDYRIVIDTRVWELPEALAEAREIQTSNASEVFGSPTLGTEGLVREIELRVVWSDGVQERAVRRTTYAIDFSSVAEGLDLPLPGLLGDALGDALDAAIDAEAAR